MHHYVEASKCSYQEATVQIIITYNFSKSHTPCLTIASNYPKCRYLKTNKWKSKILDYGKVEINNFNLNLILDALYQYPHIIVYVRVLLPSVRNTATVAGHLMVLPLYKNYPVRLV